MTRISDLPPAILVADLDFANSIRTELAGASLLSRLPPSPSALYALADAFSSISGVPRRSSLENILKFIHSLAPVARSIKILKRRLPGIYRYLHR
jgi:hypothetical protein